MPDMTGWSTRDVLKVAAVLGVKLDSEGNGFLNHQAPSAGEQVQEGDSIQAEFSSEEDVQSDEDHPEDESQEELDLDVETDRDVSN
ncbi:PASTA domain-containing protein [Alkalicoccobacillus plakortidis]